CGSFPARFNYLAYGMCPQGECASAEKRVPQPWKGLRNDKGVNQPLTQIRLHAEFLYFLVVVLPVEDVPFLATLKNGAFLALDLQARGLIDSCFLVQQIFENLTNFQADGVAVFDKVQFIDGSQSICDHVRNLIHFVTAESHSTALYFRTSSFFTLRNISW